MGIRLPMKVRLVLLLKQETVSYGVKFELIETVSGSVPCVTQVLDKSPAKKAGIQVNDVFIRINGVQTLGLSKDTINKLGKRHPKLAVVEVLNKLEINSFRFENYELDSDLAVPKLFRVHRDELDVDQFVMYVLSEYNNIREDYLQFRRNERLVIINGIKVDSKLDLISALAQLDKTQIFVMVVIDKRTETLFDELNLKVSEDFVVELEQAVTVAKMAQLQDLEKINQQLLSDIQRIKVKIQV